MNTMNRTPASIHIGTRVRATNECLAIARENFPDEVPTTPTGIVTSRGMLGFAVMFDDGTHWEATSIGGGDEPLYFTVA